MSEDQLAMAPKRSFRNLYWIAIVVVFFDQLTKVLVKGSSALGFPGMPIHSSKPLLGEIFRITFVENPGIAFGINFPALKIFFSLFSVVAAIAIFVYLQRNGTKLLFWERIALILIMGGAVGNLIDRCFYGVFYGEQPLFYGHVVDFIDFGYKENWFPVFNIADSAVSIGVTILVITLLFKKPIQPEPQLI